jgi:flagellar hook-associated protein 2
MTSISSTSSPTASTPTASTPSLDQTSSSVDRSGLTTSEAVDADPAYQARLSQADTIDTQITANQAKLQAYQNMQSLLQSLESSLGALDDGTASDDAFAARTAQLGSSSSTSADSYMSATIASGTATGTHQIEIDQVASAERIAGTTASSRTTALGLSGTLTLGTGSGTADIAITSGMALDDVVDAVNAQSTTTGVAASVIAVTSSQYMLVLTAQNTNQPITLSGDAAQSLGLADASGAVVDQLQAAQPAKLTVDGVSGIERDSNDISDILDGVTLHLNKAEVGTTLTLAVANDTSSVATAVNNFVDAYNSWRDFVIQNQATNSDGTADSNATLFGDATLRQVASQISTSLTQQVDGSSLGAVGIAFDSNNKLTIDSTALDNALASNFGAVQSLFEHQTTTSSSALTLSDHTGSSYSGSFTLDVATDANGNLTGASVGGDSSLFTVSGSTITGAAGSAYAGLTFHYSGTTSQSVQVTVSQGVADQVYQTCKSVADATTGSLSDIISNLESTDTTLQSQSDQIKSDADSYRNYLLDRYGTLEAQISSANQTATLLQTLMSYDTKNNA